MKNIYGITTCFVSAIAIVCMMSGCGKIPQTATATMMKSNVHPICRWE